MMRLKPRTKEGATPDRTALITAKEAAAVIGRCTRETRAVTLSFTF